MGRAGMLLGVLMCALCLLALLWRIPDRITDGRNIEQERAQGEYAENVSMRMYRSMDERRARHGMTPEMARAIERLREAEREPLF